MHKDLMVKDFREKVISLEEKMACLPGSTGPEAYPLLHQFADGLYIRKVSVPKGHLVVTKIHKKAHPFFMLKGEVSVLTTNGVERFTAPYYAVTKAGTKRVIYMHEDVEWVTVHATQDTDLEEIEKDPIAKDYSELDQYLDKQDAARLVDILKEE